MPILIQTMVNPGLSNSKSRIDGVVCALVVFGKLCDEMDAVRSRNIPRNRNFREPTPRRSTEVHACDNEMVPIC